MTPEEEIIKVFENTSTARAMQFLALELIRQDLDVDSLAKLARKLTAPNRMGYLAEVSAIAAENAGMPTSKQLYALANALYDQSYSWGYLNPGTPDIAKQIMRSGPQEELNRKWGIYSTLKPSELEEWILLYHLNEDYEERRRRVDQAETSLNY